MQINKTIEGSKLTICLNGRIDTTSAPVLETELKASWNGINELIFDMTDINYVSSAGLRIFLTAQKQMNKQGTMLLKNVTEDVFSVFEITGFSDILTIEKL